MTINVSFCCFAAFVSAEARRIVPSTVERVKEPHATVTANADENLGRHQLIADATSSAAKSSGIQSFVQQATNSSSQDSHSDAVDSEERTSGTEPATHFLKTTDVTELIKHRDGKDLRCCCEAENRRCQVYFMEDVDGPWWRESKCKDATPPWWFPHWHVFEHYYHDKDGERDGRCTVPDMELPLLLGRLRTSKTYCRSTQDLDGFREAITLAGIGDVVETNCPAGFRGKATECTFGAVDRGVFLPDPGCEIIPDFCKAQGKLVPDASIDAIVNVNCDGREGMTKSVKCVMVTRDQGVFDPDPARTCRT